MMNILITNNLKKNVKMIKHIKENIFLYIGIIFFISMFITFFMLFKEDDKRREQNKIN
jgi:hypothetical protein